VFAKRNCLRVLQIWFNKDQLLRRCAEAANGVSQDHSTQPRVSHDHCGSSSFCSLMPHYHMEYFLVTPASTSFYSPQALSFSTLRFYATNRYILTLTRTEMSIFHGLSINAYEKFGVLFTYTFLHFPPFGSRVV